MGYPEMVLRMLRPCVRPWWIIADYNDLFFPLELETGAVLRIPSVEHVQMRVPRVGTVLWPQKSSLTSVRKRYRIPDIQRNAS